MTTADRDDKIERERAKQQRERDAYARRITRWAVAGGLSLLWAVYVPINAADELPDLPQYVAPAFVLAVLVLVLSGYETGRGVQIERALEAAVTVDLAANRLLLEQLHEANAVRLDVVRGDIREVERKHFAYLDRISAAGIRQLAEHIDKAVERGVQDGSVIAAKEVVSQGGTAAAVVVRGLVPMQAQLSKVDERLGGVDGRLDVIDKRTEAICARLDTMSPIDGMDPVYLADMAKSVQLGREIEQRRRQDPPAETI